MTADKSLNTLRDVSARIEQIRNQMDVAINLVPYKSKDLWCRLDRIDRDLQLLKKDMGFPNEGLGVSSSEESAGIRGEIACGVGIHAIREDK